MSEHHDDTIFAVASGAGRAAVAVIRISGPACRDLLGRLTGDVPAPRRASLRVLRDGSGAILDRALVLWMPGPASFSGEDQAELHLHGGLAVRSAVLRELAAEPHCRPAEPGEFTRRAFLNRKLDLAAVEGLADLIDAETEAQRRQALRQLEGGLSERITCWRDRLADLLALIEAGLDFADEDDTPRDIDPGELAVIGRVGGEITELLAQGNRGERLREGFTVVIAGPPNAGKSTLLNAIARRDVAIVSDVPGTTRDAIEVRCDLDGLPVAFVDTAGLRDTADAIEREGVRRAEARMREADLVLWLESEGRIGEHLTLRHAEESRAAARLEARTMVLRPSRRPFGPPQDDEGESVASARTRTLAVRTKADLLTSPATTELAVSATTGHGMPELLARIGRELARLSPGAEGALVTRERHRLALEAAAECLARAEGARHNVGAELVAEDLRLALRALGRIVGEVDVEAILDRVFAQFCIGK